MLIYIVVTVPSSVCILRAPQTRNGPGITRWHECLTSPREIYDSRCIESLGLSSEKSPTGRMVISMCPGAAAGGRSE